MRRIDAQPLNFMSSCAYIQEQLKSEVISMSQRDLQDLQRHLSAAAVIVARLLERSDGSPGPGMRNPAYFRDTGHLSDAGIEALYKLFDHGVSVEQVAREMGISLRGAASRRQAWARKREMR